jgi:hypothetical protein
MRAVRQLGVRHLGALVLTAVLWHAVAWTAHNHHGELGTRRTECVVCATVHVPAVLPLPLPVPLLPVWGAAPAVTATRPPRSGDIRARSSRAPPAIAPTFVA